MAAEVVDEPLAALRDRRAAVDARDRVRDRHGVARRVRVERGGEDALGDHVDGHEVDVRVGPAHDRAQVAAADQRDEAAERGGAVDPAREGMRASSPRRRSAARSRAARARARSQSRCSARHFVKRVRVGMAGLARGARARRRAPAWIASRSASAGARQRREHLAHRHVFAGVRRHVGRRDRDHALEAASQRARARASRGSRRRSPRSASRSGRSNSTDAATWSTCVTRAASAARASGASAQSGCVTSPSTTSTRSVQPGGSAAKQAERATSCVEAVARRAARARADQHVHALDAELLAAPQQRLEHDLADEAGRAGEQDLAQAQAWCSGRWLPMPNTFCGSTARFTASLQASAPGESDPRQEPLAQLADAVVVRERAAASAGSRRAPRARAPRTPRSGARRPCSRRRSRSRCRRRSGRAASRGTVTNGLPGQAARARAPRARARFTFSVSAIAWLHGTEVSNDSREDPVVHHEVADVGDRRR